MSRIGKEGEEEEVFLFVREAPTKQCRGVAAVAADIASLSSTPSPILGHRLGGHREGDWGVKIFANFVFTLSFFES